MNKASQQVTGRFLPFSFYCLSLVGLVFLAQSPPTAAQTRLVTSDGRVIIIERPKPTTALRSRWIKPDEVGISAVPDIEPEEEVIADSAGEEPLGQLFDVLGRNVQPVDVNIPMAPNDSAEAPAQEIPVKLSSRIEVLGQDEGDELPQLLAELLRDSGEQLVEFKIVQVQVSADQIRYFHESDRSHAEYVAGLLTGVFDVLRVRDYSFFRPSPPEGLLEIWIQ